MRKIPIKNYATIVGLVGILVCFGKETNLTAETAENCPYIAKSNLAVYIMTPDGDV